MDQGRELNNKSICQNDEYHTADQQHSTRGPGPPTCTPPTYAQSMHTAHACPPAPVARTAYIGAHTHTHTHTCRHTHTNHLLHQAGALYSCPTQEHSHSRTGREHAVRKAAGAAPQKLQRSERALPPSASSLCLPCCPLTPPCNALLAPPPATGRTCASARTGASVLPRPPGCLASLSPTLQHGAMQREGRTGIL